MRSRSGFGNLSGTAVWCALSLAGFIADTPDSADQVGSSSLPSRRWPHFGDWHMPHTPETLVTSCRCFQPFLPKHSKGSSCYSAIFAQAFVNRPPLMAPSRSAGSTSMLCSFDTPVLRAHGYASLPLASNCLSVCHLLLPLQLLKACRYRAATHRLFAVHRSFVFSAPFAQPGRRNQQCSNR